MLRKTRYVGASMLVLTVLQGCSGFNYKRMTYEVLRQQDCKLNEPGGFCERGYSNEFLEYERLRAEYIRSVQEAEFWQASDEAPAELFLATRN